MCGITGFIDFRHNSSLETLKKQTDTLSHRGPDGEGNEVYSTEQAHIGLGHRRLSVIDLSEGGSQPKAYKSLHITFNGEIYNFQEVKNELRARGHVFNSQSDTEMVLHAFEEWGIACLQKFIGMFAFVLYDEKTESVYCVRDRAGVKPFYYYWLNGLFLFGSELKSLLSHPQFTKEINTEAVAGFMQYGYVPADHCIWKHTYKLRPGHFLQFNVANKNFTIKKYWNVYDAYNKPKLKINFEDAKTETEAILQTACNYRMVADVPVGVFLSGGYDSSTVTALLQKDSTDKIKTFTIGVPDAGLNEAPYAKDIAAYLGTDHTEYYCTEKEALSILPDLPLYFDEPFADSSAIPTILVSRIARQKVTVVLSADAGDEIFAGYNKYNYMHKILKRVQAMPGFMRSGVANVMSKISSDKIPFLSKTYHFHSRYEKFKNILIDTNSKSINHTLSRHFSDSEINKLFLLAQKPLPTLFDSEELEKEHESWLTAMLAVDYQTYLPDDVLTKVDRATMSVGLEGREPFLDHRLIEWAAQLPDEFKFNKGEKKYILKRINEKYIPHKLLNRPKMGFGIPIEKWLLEPLKETVMFYCSETAMQKQNIFRLDVIKKIVDDFYNGKKENSIKIWNLLMFQMWYAKWM